MRHGSRWAHRRRSLLLSAVLLGWSGCATDRPARPPAAAQPWLEEGFAGRRITTAHFDVISTVRDAEFEAALPAFVEAAYRHYETTLPPSGQVDSKLTMYVFGSRAEWERFTRRRFPVRFPVYSRIRAGGFTEGDVSVSFYPNRAATLATLAHEGWHQYVDSRFDSTIPAWLNEGLACRHEAVQFTGPKPRFMPRHNTFRINDLREAVQMDTLLSLPRLVTTDAGQVISLSGTRAAETYYAQAWALIDFLRHGAGGRHADAFDRLLADITNDTFRIRLSAARLSTSDAAGLSLGELAFQTYFGCASAAVADEYYDHLIRLTGF